MHSPSGALANLPACWDGQEVHVDDDAAAQVHKAFPRLNNTYRREAKHHKLTTEMHGIITLLTVRL
jgi:hypothetical protein